MGEQETIIGADKARPVGTTLALLGIAIIIAMIIASLAYFGQDILHGLSTAARSTMGKFILLIAIIFLAVGIWAGLNCWRDMKFAQNIFALLAMAGALVLGGACVKYRVDRANDYIRLEPAPNVTSYAAITGAEMILTAPSSLQSSDGEIIILEGNETVILPQGSAVNIRRLATQSENANPAQGANPETDKSPKTTPKLPLDPGIILFGLLVLMYIVFVLDAVRVIVVPAPPEEDRKWTFKESLFYRVSIWQENIREHLDLIFMTPGQPYILLGIIGTFWGLIGMLASIDPTQIMGFSDTFSQGANEADKLEFKILFNKLSFNAVLSLVSSGVGVIMAYAAHYLSENEPDNIAPTEKAAAEAAKAAATEVAKAAAAHPPEKPKPASKPVEEKALVKPAQKRKPAPPPKKTGNKVVKKDLKKGKK